MTPELAVAEYEELAAVDRLDRAFDEFDDIVVASSFGLEDVVVLDVVHRELDRRPPVVFLDTLYHFEETLDFVDSFTDEYDVDLRVYRPEQGTRGEFERVHGERLWERDIGRFHELTKLRQIDDALDGRDAWVTGIRREQADSRADADPVERDDAHGLVKLNPLVDWVFDDVRSHVEEHDVPYNPLHDEGYLSIGDEPLTEPVEDGESQRDGRWRGEDKTECGLHGDG